MKINCLGDIHGNLDNITLLPNTIQLGDYNLFGYDIIFTNDGTGYYKHYPEFPIYFIDGNHDNHLILKHNSDDIQKVHDNVFYIPRGFISGKTMFIGGGDSIDKSMRTPGDDWFPEESFSWEQQNRILSNVSDIEVILSHDCPYSYIKQMQNNIFKSNSQLFLDAVFDHFKPKMWIFGHYHRSYDIVLNDCRFIGLNIDEYKEINIPIDNRMFNQNKS